MKNTLLLLLVFGSLHSAGQSELVTSKKGDFRLKLGLPYFNHLMLVPSNTITVNKVGFIGESVGMAYNYSDNRFLEFSFSFVGVANHPLPFPIDREGDYTTQYSSYFSLSHNHQVNKMTYGYGVNYAFNTWAEGFRSFENPALNTRNQIDNQAIGLTLNSFYQIRKSFHLGMIYRPTYFRRGNTFGHQYEHLVSIELLWRIKLNRKN